MPVDPELRSLDIDIPAQPEALVKLSLLLAEDDINLQAVSQLIESDMALAASVMKAVNSSLYGLKGRVQTVHQAITYLGMREVAAITFEMGLRAAFPPAPELEPIWRRAAGLFEECGKAVLFRHASDHYRSMLRAAGNDVELMSLERAGFGGSHEALGAALCETWGLAAPAVASVRHHVELHAGGDLPAGLQRAGVLALSAVAAAVMHDPEQIEAVVHRVMPQVPLDETLVLRAARKVHAQLEESHAHGR